VRRVLRFLLAGAVTPGLVVSPITVMFESDLNEDAARQKVTRRAFLLSGGMVAAAVAAWSLHSAPPPLSTESPSGPAPETTIAEFSDAGVLTRTIRVQKIVKSDAEWRRQLSANAFDIARRADTEMAYTGSYWNLHQRGIYRCICCNTALFSSQTKFDSGTGWPSFWQPIARENIAETEDTSFGVRTAVACARCDAHLGHVFNDGPPPTGLRYCMNSASTVFKATV
jgi:peptide-methionine (R)-S-oxide reductase